MGVRILKAKRMLLNLTQKELAREVGIDLKSYNLKENGKREFKMDEAKKIITLLNLNLTEVNEIFFNSIIKK